MKRFFLYCMFAAACFMSQAQMRFVSYNVENLFDTKHDSLKLDEDFTPEGKLKWTQTRYNRKLENLSRVFAKIGGIEMPAVIGLCEVENENCIKDLLKTNSLRRVDYQYIHRESPDQRGIDCAILYDLKQFTLLASGFIPVPMPVDERPTRDIVYVKGEIQLRSAKTHRIYNDTIHILMCHLPSQLGGAEQTAFKRAIAHRVLQHTVDSISNTHFFPRIIIMGDMNSKPTDHLRGMHNLMLPMEEEMKGKAGTHKWKEKWSYLDQIYVSDALYHHVKAHVYNEYWLLEDDRQFGGEQPMRCYNFNNWQPGYSDHLPIYLEL